MARPFFIGIAGPSCSGKTALARRLSEDLDQAPVIPLDAYYRDLSHSPLGERARVNFDNPDALELDLLGAHLAALAAGRSIERPVYDFAAHVRTRSTVTVAAAQYILVEGLFVLSHPPLRDAMHCTVYVAIDDETALERRTARDVADRGRTTAAVRERFLGHVLPMATRFVVPSRDFADVVVSGTAPLAKGAEVVLALIDGLD